MSSTVSLVLFLLITITSLVCAAKAVVPTNRKKTPEKSKALFNIGLITPYQVFHQREYSKAIQTGIVGVKKMNLNFLNDYDFETINVHHYMMNLIPGPSSAKFVMCNEFLQNNVSTIAYIKREEYGQNNEPVENFLQLADGLGIPVISWIADNSGIVQNDAPRRFQIQLAPTIEHQSAAMLSILEHYNWHQFSIVTSQMDGHDNFVQAVRERANEMKDYFIFTILNSIVFNRSSDLLELVNSKSRVMLLYCTKEEALNIFVAADELNIVGQDFVWIVSQSVIENAQHPDLPIGVLGVHFDTSIATLIDAVPTALKVYALGVENFLSDPTNNSSLLNTEHLSCKEEAEPGWDIGEIFYQHLRNVSLERTANHKPNIEFNAQGNMKNIYLKVMNLRPNPHNGTLVWEEIGVWKSWAPLLEQLHIHRIVWPGNSHTQPKAN